jgi:hypothetical protein
MPLKRLLLLSSACILFSSASAAADIQKDSDGDGRTDTWVTLGKRGKPDVIAMDRYPSKRLDGKPDVWLHMEGDKIVLREWDRNFDGKPDFRAYERDKRLLKKEYDDNFDGRFERKVDAPARGSDGRTKTRPYDPTQI